jgi:hypothetical protein
MDWATKDRERKQKIEEQKKILLATSDFDAEKLPVSDRYQRIRYLREIEAHEWLQDLRRKMIITVTPIKKQYAHKKTKVIFNND